MIVYNIICLFSALFTLYIFSTGIGIIAKELSCISKRQFKLYIKASTFEYLIVFALIASLYIAFTKAPLSL